MRQLWRAAASGGGGGGWPPPPPPAAVWRAGSYVLLVGRRITRAVRHRRARSGVHVYQLVGHGFGSDFPPLRVDRLPPPVPGGVERSVPGYEVRQLIGIGQLGEVHRAYQPSVGREVALRIFGRDDGVPSAVRAPLRDRIAADHPRRAPACCSAPRLLARAEPGRDGEPT